MEQHQDSAYGAAKQPAALSWSQDRRLKFIDFRLRWEGRINRNDLVEFFKISAPQATLDLAKYAESAPDNLTYDPRSKAYVKTRFFHPVFGRSASKTYLNELLALESGVMEPAACFVRWQPSIATVPVPGRHVDGEVLEVLVQAIRERRMITVEYQTMGREQPTQRVLSPHALANDSQRWHVRAYCHSRENFRDFVLARLKPLSLGGTTSLAIGEDKAWSQEVLLVVAAHPALPPASRAALEVDYGMTDGRLTLRCRQAMLLYSLIRLGLLEEKPHPAAQQIVLVNQAEVEPFLEELGHSFNGRQVRLFQE